MSQRRSAVIAAVRPATAATVVLATAAVVNVIAGSAVEPIVAAATQDNRDAFDRLLRYVERGDRDIGRRQVRQGWAKVFVFEIPFRRVGKYRKAQSRARADDRGVWDRCGGDFHQPLRSS